MVTHSFPSRIFARAYPPSQSQSSGLTWSTRLGNKASDSDTQASLLPDGKTDARKNFVEYTQDQIWSHFFQFVKEGKRDKQQVLGSSLPVRNDLTYRFFDPLSISTTREY